MYIAKKFNPFCRLCLHFFNDFLICAEVFHSMQFDWLIMLALFVYVVRGIEPRDLHMLWHKCSTTEVLSPTIVKFADFWYYCAWYWDSIQEVLTCFYCFKCFSLYNFSSVTKFLVLCLNLLFILILLVQLRNRNLVSVFCMWISKLNSIICWICYIFTSIWLENQKR